MPFSAISVQISAAGSTGFGWTYSTAAAAAVVTDHLASAITGRDAFDIEGGWAAMHQACRNLGTAGLVMQAINAVDIAMWDLEARLLDGPGVELRAPMAPTPAASRDAGRSSTFRQRGFVCS